MLYRRYFSTDMKRHHDQEKLQKSLLWAYSFRRFQSMNITVVSKGADRHAWL